MRQTGLWVAGVVVLLAAGCKKPEPVKQEPNWLLGKWKESTGKEGCPLEIVFEEKQETRVYKTVSLPLRATYYGTRERMYALTDKTMQGYVPTSPTHVEMEFKGCEYDRE